MPKGIFIREKPSPLKGIPRTEEVKRKISIANSSEKNGMWKGDKAKYRAIHAWIVSHYGKANKCEKNPQHINAKVYDWANINGRYKRDRKDFIMLCRSCHSKFDGKIPPVNWGNRNRWKQAKDLHKERKDC